MSQTDAASWGFALAATISGDAGGTLAAKGVRNADREAASRHARQLASLEPEARRAAVAALVRQWASPSFSLSAAQRARVPARALGVLMPPAAQPSAPEPRPWRRSEARGLPHDDPHAPTELARPDYDPPPGLRAVIRRALEQVSEILLDADPQQSSERDAT